MKSPFQISNFKSQIALAALLCALCVSVVESASAQSTNIVGTNQVVISPIPPPNAFGAVAPPPPTDTGSFFATVQSWATSFDTNNLWNTRGSVSAGVDTIQNSKVNLANNLRLSYEVTGGLALEAGFRDSGVAGVMVSFQGGLAYHIKMLDLQIMPYLNGGYDRVNASRMFGEVGLRAEKKMTKYTFIGVSIGQQFPTDRRVYSAYTGFTF